MVVCCSRLGKKRYELFARYLAFARVVVCRLLTELFSWRK